MRRISLLSSLLLCIMLVFASEGRPAIQKPEPPPKPFTTCPITLTGSGPGTLWTSPQEALNGARAWIASKTAIICSGDITVQEGMSPEPGMTCYTATFSYETNGKCLPRY